MQNWLLPAFISLFIYGLWGFFPKLAVTHIQPASALVYEIGGALLVGLFALYLVDFRPEVHAQGILFAVLTGVAGMAGTLFYFSAAKTGKISVVVSMTALYPLITILLAAVFLHEPISARQMLGMVFAVIAILLFTV
ncbi:MAG: EamA family transporter [Thermodesulfobacteriota bacterium]